MKETDLSLTLSYEGKDTENHQIDFYDIAQALIGFQRSLALTSHLILNGKVIKRATDLEGAKILALPPEEGSWKITAGIILSGLWVAGMAPSNSFTGHLIFSAYDYIVSESLGFHVDYTQSLGQLYERHREKRSNLPIIGQSQLDSVVENCERNIIQIHRPISGSGTAERAQIISTVEGKRKSFELSFNKDTFDYMITTDLRETPSEFVGYVSSYNINTYKGRIFIPILERSIPFLLTDVARDEKSISKVTNNLVANSETKYERKKSVCFLAHEFLSRTKRLKRLDVIKVKRP